MQLNELSGALAVLSAMITPAVLISACGSLIIATSTRLGRVIDRTRTVSEQWQEVAQAEAEGDVNTALLEERRTLLYDMLGRLTRRSRILQRAMSRLYMALSVFVATSVAIGVVAVGGQEYAWVPIVLGLGGAGLLFGATVLLIWESRLALTAIHDEMDFMLRRGQSLASEELLARHPERGWPVRNRPGRG